MNEPLEGAVLDRVNQAPFAGQLIEAIKIYREATGCGLSEAKDLIESLESRLHVESPERFTAAPRQVTKISPAGCALLLVLVAIAIGGLIFLRDEPSRLAGHSTVTLLARFLGSPTSQLQPSGLSSSDCKRSPSGAGSRLTHVRSTSTTSIRSRRCMRSLSRNDVSFICTSGARLNAWQVGVVLDSIDLGRGKEMVLADFFSRENNVNRVARLAAGAVQKHVDPGRMADKRIRREPTPPSPDRDRRAATAGRHPGYFAPPLHPLR